MLLDPPLLLWNTPLGTEVSKHPVNLDRAPRRREHAHFHTMSSRTGTKKLWSLPLQTKGDLPGGSQCTEHLRITGLEA